MTPLKRQRYFGFERYHKPFTPLRFGNCRDIEVGIKVAPCDFERLLTQWKTVKLLKVVKVVD
jgi:hypothetical protein